MKKIGIFLLKVVGVFITFVTVMFGILWVLGKAAENTGLLDDPYGR